MNGAENRRLARVGWTRGDAPDALVTREWLVTNGLGGYASGTLGGVSTRRFHGVLVAALHAPIGRTMALSRLDVDLVIDGRPPEPLEGSERADGSLELPRALVEVRFEEGLPVWRYETGGCVIEKRLVLPRGRNATFVSWCVVSAAAPLALHVRPGLHVRPHEGSLARDLGRPYRTSFEGNRWCVHAGPGLPTIDFRVFALSARMTLDGVNEPELLYREERDRGYDCRGSLFSPGVIAIVLGRGEDATILVSADEDDAQLQRLRGGAVEREQRRRAALRDVAHPSARAGVGAELVLAADAFLVYPATRDEAAGVGANGANAACTVIAGYPWFTDWGRDTMISLEGLALLTGRHAEAGRTLRMFAGHVKDGLIPNLFPESGVEGLYHTADATMWFFHAIDRYVTLTGDAAILSTLLPVLEDIVAHHVRGTRFGIRVDPTDDLLTQGAEGYQLTWMDAKVDGWVVTPRRGKAVEINALWYNALCLLARWLGDAGHGDRADAVARRAARVRASFNRRFWCEPKGHLFDVVDGEAGDDASLRPNQIFALSLPNPVLDDARWSPVLHTVRDALLTPVGLRSLAPGEPNYQARYDGDLRARDAAYHQGTVWGWLAGAFVDAWLRVHPGDVNGARGALSGFVGHLGEACIGSISEIFDAEPPFTPRGCFAQAWSVAEVLRVWVKTSAPETLGAASPR